MMNLNDKVAIITGSTRGIGKAIALRFAKDGARVVINGVANTEKGMAVATEINKAGAEALVVMADVSKRGQAEQLIDDTVKAFGKIDILVSNAGIVIDKPFVESLDEDWERSININLRGFFNVARAALPHMIERQYGRIIATGSCITDIADFGGNKYSICTASKGGIVMMMRPMAAEMAAHGITVNAVAPGYIATEMLDEIDAEGLDEALKIIPMRRYGKPEEIAAAMSFLASDEAAYITGQILRVNGGMAMG
jgi:NAD(P)-dependent dehydrogenase (short-subunit alcohol dehydrogenase family)